MNSYVRAVQCISALALLVGASAASAGEMGPTSGETVSIHITIPPHVQLSAPDELASGEAANVAHRLCVTSNGIGRYRVMLLSVADAREDHLSSPVPFAIGHESELGTYCTSMNADGPGTHVSTVRAAAFGAEPLIVLVVPD